MHGTANATMEMEQPSATSLPYARTKPYANEPISVLLVEDDVSDTMLTEVSLDASGIEYDLHTLDSGLDVLAYLYRQGKYRDEHKPDLLLLDLSLPNKDGFEVLAEMAVHRERLGNIPVVIMTGDHHSTFLRHSYDLNIAAYLLKPCTPEKLRKAFAAIRKSAL